MLGGALGCSRSWLALVSLTEAVTQITLRAFLCDKSINADVYCYSYLERQHKNMLGNLSKLPKSSSGGSSDAEQQQIAVKRV
jgi:hypothetical protein